MMEELELKAMMEELEAREVTEPEEEAPESRHSRRLLSTPVCLLHVRPTGGTPRRRLLQTLDNTVQSPRRRLLQTLDQTVQSVQQYSASVLHAASMARQQQARVTGPDLQAVLVALNLLSAGRACGARQLLCCNVLLKHIQTVLHVGPSLVKLY